MLLANPNQAAKRDSDVLYRGTSLGHLTVRNKLVAAATAICWKWVLNILSSTHFMKTLVLFYGVPITIPCNHFQWTISYIWCWDTRMGNYLE